MLNISISDFLLSRGSAVQRTSSVGYYSACWMYVLCLTFPVTNSLLLCIIIIVPVCTCIMPRCLIVFISLPITFRFLHAGINWFRQIPFPACQWRCALRCALRCWGSRHRLRTHNWLNALLGFPLTLRLLLIPMPILGDRSTFSPLVCPCHSHTINRVPDCPDRGPALFTKRADQTWRAYEYISLTIMTIINH